MAVEGAEGDFVGRCGAAADTKESPSAIHSSMHRRLVGAPEGQHHGRHSQS